MPALFSFSACSASLRGTLGFSPAANCQRAAKGARRHRSSGRPTHSTIPYITIHLWELKQFFELFLQPPWPMSRAGRMRARREKLKAKG